MDLVTLTADQMGYVQKPVRITKIEDDPENGLAITAEDFPYGIAKPTLYPKQTSLAVSDLPALADPGNSEPLILELPDEFTNFQGYTLRIYAAPDTPGHWGGADVWMSGDNVEFDQVGTITTPALMGVLTSSMTTGTGDPDTQSASIEMSSSLQLTPSSTFNFDNHSESSLLAIIDAGGTFEIVGYRNATLTAANTYAVDTFHRGLFGTTRAAHSAGAKVVKMDQGHLEITYPPSQVGETSYVKLTSFNSVGGRLQDVSSVASDSFILTGAFPGFFDKTTGKLYSMSQVTGAGALATKNNVDLATTDVINKTAGNITYSGGATVDSLKPTEAGAEKTTGKSLTLLIDRNLFNIADDPTSGRFAGVQAGATADGFQILTNPDFAGGSLTGYSVYDNAASGKVTHLAVSDNTTPNSSGWNLQITTAAGTPAPNPGLGGFFRGINVDSGAFATNTYHRGATIMWRIRANVPAGFTINFASNTTGTGGTFTWITSQAGTGSYFDYVGKQVIGTSGTFSSTGFFYLTGTAPVTWHVAVCSAVCVTHPAGFGVSDVDPNRRAIVDLSQAGHLNKTLDFIPNGSSSFAVSSIDANRRAIVDFTQAAHVGKTLDNIGDTTSFKRTTPNQIQYLSSTTGQSSTSTVFNPQGSILPNQGILITFQALPTVIIGSWTAQSLLRSDSSSLTINASAGTNLAINGDMESGSVGSNEPTWASAGGNPLVTANDFVHGGSKAGKVAGGNTSFNGQVVNVTAGQVYCYEGWIKNDALPTSTGHGTFLVVSPSTGVSNFTLITSALPSGGVDHSTTTQIQVGFDANGTAHGYSFFQVYFSPNQTGQVLLYTLHVSITGSGWFDDIKAYPFSGALYTGLSASTTYHLYPYGQVSNGNLRFANGAPPPTSVSDTFAQQSVLDGRVGFQPCSITTPAAGTSTPSTGTGGGSGTCPECNEPVYIERYSEDGVLMFSGKVKAGDVRIGYESDDGTIKRGDFLKGHSFKKNAEVYRAVQKVTHVHCNGWVIVDGHRVTACEHVYHDGRWMPAWKVPGATHDRLSSWKVLIQVEADWDDEHNFYVGDLLIHNSIILPC